MDRRGFLRLSIFTFLHHIHLGMHVRELRGAPSLKGMPQKTGARDMLNTHLLSGRMLARTHTCTQDGFCRPRKAAQCCHLLFTLPPRVHCRCGHHSGGIEENGIISAKCSPSLHLSFWEPRARVLPNCTHFLHKLHMAVAALHIHQGALCQSGGSVPHITAG